MVFKTELQRLMALEPFFETQLNNLYQQGGSLRTDGREGHRPTIRKTFVRSRVENQESFPRGTPACV